MSRRAPSRASLIAVLTMTVAVLAACTATQPEPSSGAAGGSGASAGTMQGGAPAVPASAVERGRYLATILACGDCHTPMVMGPQGPHPDATRLLSGHPEGMAMPPAPAGGDSPWIWHGAATNTAYAGPWGVSYAINITPDEVTGIGSWTEEIFINTMRSGKHWGQSRPILPPMPWAAYGQMTDDDLKALFAYLRTVPAIRNQAPEAVVAPPPAAP